MKAYYLNKYGPANRAFELRETKLSAPGKNQVLVDAEAFGLNYADVMARLGLYGEAPSLPCILGYEVCGRISAIGKEVEQHWLGKRVVAFCRFGGYAQQVLTDHRALAEIPEDWETGKAVSLGTQYSTAWYAGMIASRFRAGEIVLIQSAAGGVGTALVQIAKWQKCTVIGTSGSDVKLDHIKASGADLALNYHDTGFKEKILRYTNNRGLDAVFDAVGGSVFKKSFRLLAPSGRITGFGAASRVGIHFFPKLVLAFKFGFMHPALLMMSSRSMIGINMLKVAEYRPELLQESMHNVVELTKQGILQPLTGRSYSFTQLAEAHEHLASGKSTGKLVINW